MVDPITGAELGGDMMNAIRAAIMHNDRDGKFAISDDNKVLAYRNVFLGHPDGPLVLKDLLVRFGLFRASLDPVDMIQKNIALEILSCCGVDEGVMINTILNSKE
jgi:hypothetical protein